MVAVAAIHHCGRRSDSQRAPAAAAAWLLWPSLRTSSRRLALAVVPAAVVLHEVQRGQRAQQSVKGVGMAAGGGSERVAAGRAGG